MSPGPPAGGLPPRPAHGAAPGGSSSSSAAAAGAPLVSVVMPTYNYAHFVGEALESLRAQTHARWECLVIDDGSTDDTAAVMARHAGRDPRIRYFSQENRGQSAARNVGLSHASGRYVQFLDADDRLEPLKLERQVEFLERHAEVDIVYGGVHYFNAAGVFEGGRHSVEDDNVPLDAGASGRGREMVAALLRRNLTVINAPLLRREVVESVGRFDEKILAEDWDYWLRCAVAGKCFRYADSAGARALVRAHASSSSRDRARMYRSALVVRRKFAAATVDAGLLALNRELAAADEGYLGVEEAAGGRRLAGVRGLLRAARLERRTRWRLKWMLCALAAPFVPGARLRRLVSASLTGKVAGLRRRKSGPEPT